MAVMMLFMLIAMMAMMMVTTMMTMMMSRGNEWVTMAACGLIMGCSALAYTIATFIRSKGDDDSEDGIVVVVVVVHRNNFQEAQGKAGSWELPRDFLRPHKQDGSIYPHLSLHCPIKLANIRLREEKDMPVLILTIC